MSSRRLVPAALVAALLAAPGAAATLVVANKAEATLSLLDLASGEVVATLPTGDGPHEIGISPDGRFALVTNYGSREAGSSLTLVDVAAARVVRTIDLGDSRRPHGVVWLDARRALVTAEANRALLDVDVEAGVVRNALPTDQEVSHMVAVTPDAARAFVANIGSGTVTAIDLALGWKRSHVATGAGAEGIALAAAGREVWVTNREADTVTVIDAASLEKLAELASPGFPIRAAATPDGRVLVTHARGGHLTVFSAAERGEIGRLTFDLASLGTANRLFGDRFGDSTVPIGVVVSSDGSRAYVAHAHADAITEVDLAGELRVLRTLRAGREPDGMGWTAVDARRP
ncbi:MAG: gluconolaconase [Thermoanaerobaculia bacterium]|nr:gluconolaconase [Thermoanaerobaculia bacterium]